MKTIKLSAIAFLMAMGVLMMNGCGSSDSGGTSSQMTETAQSRPEDNKASESTGVIDGMADDVESRAESGIDHITGGSDSGSQTK